MNTAVDSIKVSVIANRLDAICKQIGQTMLRTSRSPIFSEARDFVTAVFDARLRLVAQTAYIPVLMGALPFAMRSIADAYRGDIHDGDVFILNDPYRGNNHPPDITIAKPVFHGGELRFWSATKGHHADVGGRGVVGYNPQARSVFDECIRIPPAKLWIAGRVNRAILDVVLANVHLPFLVEGDLNCQVGACTIGARSLVALLDKYGARTLEQAIDRIFDASERHMRAAIRALPNGVYAAERVIDHDGIDKHRRIAVRLDLKVEEQDLVFDFARTDRQASGYVNSTLANTSSACFLALFTSIGADIRFDEGALRALHVTAPQGSIVNPRDPAPVTACTISAAQAIIEAVYLALAQAAPKRVDAAWSRSCTAATTGFNPRTGRPFGDIQFLSKGGGGASFGLDGWDHIGTIVCAGGLRSPDPELHELVDPFTILTCEYWTDSAGAGQWRGGLGTIHRWRVDADEVAAVTFGGGIFPQTAPFGLAGGHGAPPHHLAVRKHNGQLFELDTETPITLEKGDVFENHQSGGGGYGDPYHRSVSAVLEDVVNGLVSIEAARTDYGAVIDPATMTIDPDGTRRLRRA
jgi:N-methylhydantoinase B